MIRTSDNAIISNTFLECGTLPDIAVLPNGNYIYGVGNGVSIIRTSDNTIVTTISVGDTPRGVAVLPDGNFIYVTSLLSDYVSVIGY